MHALKIAAWTVGAITLLACGVDSKPGGISDVPASPGGAGTSAAPAKSAAAKVKAWGAGVYKVGEDITAGSYKTEGAAGFGCYWERLKSDSGELTDIIANDMIYEGAPGRMTVKSTDKFVKFTGDCKWVKA